MEEQQYGAGIWHFATYVDRYATDGYGEPRSVLDAIELAGKVQDLSVVDINYPYFGGNFTHEDIKVAVDKAGLGVIGITPENFEKVIGCRAKKTIKENEPITWGKITKSI